MKSLLARLAAITLLSAAVAVVPSAATAHETCDSPEDVPIVLEFGSLEGEDRILCAQHSVGKTGLEALQEAGIQTADTSGSPAMVCRIEGQPTPAQEKCGNALNGPGYWAFMVAKEGQPWDYAAVGLQEYELAEGDYVALKHHLMADGENVEVAARADAATRADAEVAGHGEETSKDEHAGGDHADDDDSSFAAVALPIAIVAALLVAVAAFVVARRRRA
ncbi:hypothetical protein AFL01nite_25610 [Aeromicrobium flavum]|uniref:DUF4430 domain-containing protein n=1 Tax=Aeromicrobium flavum TaxID=416568 RepID=A0A512HXT1_9ACTN|nr:hypothetical protein [Aeromicrobium flavum]GEO90234.1 hypothetical protein AFL01nite_25610 [Aeromicrobium flavum]